VSSRVVGIDLGTLNSCVATVEDGRAVILSEDQRTTVPSCLAFKGEKELVGGAARRYAVTDPENTIIAVKRLLGHPFDSDEIRAALAVTPYPIVSSPTGDVLLNIAGRELTPIEVSAHILGCVRELAEKALGKPVKQAVISVPAHFNDVQRKATKLAAEHAGIEVLRLINEPTAASFAYGYKKGEDFTLAVYDLGGGTFDITIMRAKGDTFEVLATDGDSYLGGEDFDRAIAAWLTEKFESANKMEIGADDTALLRLKEAAEKAKVELAEVESTQIDLPYLAQLPDGGHVDFSVVLNRSQMAKLVQPLIQRTLELCSRCIDNASVATCELDDVLMVGGQSRMAAVQEAVAELFGREPRRDINPDEVVAQGAALYGYSISADALKTRAECAAGEELEMALKGTEVARKLIDGVDELSQRSLGDDSLQSLLDELLQATGCDDSVRGPDLSADSDADLPSTYEAARDELLQMDYKMKELAAKFESGSDDNLERALEQISEELSAAHSASDRASEYLAEAEQHAAARKVDLQDVTSLPLGIGTVGNVFSMLIDQNTPVPAEHRRMFTTNENDQAEVEIRVYQGRSRDSTENQLLGSFTLTGIASAPRLTPKIEVAFCIDADGILSVSATDAASGIKQGIRVEDPLGVQANASKRDS
jgi:molecular chaperone DnaK (HSP70)